MWKLFGALAALPVLVASLASTDSIQDADIAQSGYLPNHNMDPNVVESDEFGILWKYTSDQSLEQHYAKPLIYTMNNTELVITASSMNYVRVFDAKTGVLVTQRQLNPPFLSSDLECGDIPNYVGIIGTPVLDPDTSIVYMLVKGYKNNATSGGLENGIYNMYALNIPDLSDAEGFPVLIDGHNADNDHTRYFVGGTILNRPSLATVNGQIIAGFGGHCDKFNYTGYVLSVSTTPGVGVTGLFAMEAAPGAEPSSGELTTEDGGGAGIWQSGMGLSVSGSNVFLVTGNGEGHANVDVPASGRLPLSTLDECIVKLQVGANGGFTLADYFEPYEYIGMDAGDADLGASGLCLFDSDAFSSTNVQNIAATVGKSKKVYIVNVDNLGGFKQGPGGTDNVLQTISSSNSVFGGIGTYPLEGGYFYFTPINEPTYAYGFSNDSGAPFFSLAGQSVQLSTGRVGVGQPTITTMGGLPGSGIVWITDVGLGLLAYKAVPQNGVLVPISLPALPGLNKFGRPAFGDGILFVTANNQIYCLGAPVNAPLDCTSPLNFGDVVTGGTKTMEVTCTAKIAIKAVTGCNTTDSTFECDSKTLPTGAVASGSKFTFPVTWNLTVASVNDAANVSYGRVLPGVVSAVLDLYTTNGVADYSNTTGISVTGDLISSDPYLYVLPGSVDFGGLVLGSADATTGLVASATAQNLGNGTLTFTGFAWQNATLGGTESTQPYHNITGGTGKIALGGGFTASSFPKVGATLMGDDSFDIPMVFNTTQIGTQAILVTIWSDGGVDTMLLSASAGTPPITHLYVSTGNGTFSDKEPLSVAFGNIQSSLSTEVTKTMTLKMCNDGGSVMTVTKSKPPVSQLLTAAHPDTDLSEGSQIEVGACKTADIIVYAPAVQPNHPAQNLSDAWVLNTDGMDALNPTQDFGVHNVLCTAELLTPQVGPLLADGQARFQWLGCFNDDSGRNLAKQVNTNAQEATNTNQQCQQLCYAAGYIFAGTEYHEECWCGNTLSNPTSYAGTDFNYCTFGCNGDDDQDCGGDGGYLSLYADQTQFNITSWLGNPAHNGTGGSTTPPGNGGGGAPGSPPLTEPPVINGQWNYTGCYIDLADNTRTLPDLTTSNNNMTLEACGTFCTSSANNGASFNYFGTTYGTQCYCGYTLNSTLATSEADCNDPCAGNATELCGAGSRLNVYKNHVVSSPPKPPAHKAQVGDFAWQGCYTEATTGRALGGDSEANDDMTLEVCGAYCAAGSFTMWGVEYGRECYCGNALGAGAVKTTTTDCDMLCAADSEEYCGAGSRMDLYSYDPAAASSTAASSSTTAVVSTSVLASTTSPSMAPTTVASSVVSSTTAVAPTTVVSSAASTTATPTTASPTTATPTTDVQSTASASTAQSSTHVTAITSTGGITPIGPESSTGTPTTVPLSSPTTSPSKKPTTSQSPSPTSSPSTSTVAPSSTSTSSSKTTPVTTKTKTKTKKTKTSTKSSSTSTSSSKTTPKTTSTTKTTKTSTTVASIPPTTASSTSTVPPTTKSPPPPASSKPPASSTATATLGYHHIGCYAEVSSGHVLPQILTNNSMTPELCIRYAREKALAASSTAAPSYLYLEYHRECYAGASLDFSGSAVTSLVGKHACTDVCSGSVTTNAAGVKTTGTAAYCGGPAQFDLYALSATTVTFPTSGGALVTQTA